VQDGRFTDNPTQAKIHVCSMGFLGSLFPYFKPNFDGIRQHLAELNSYAGESSTMQAFLQASHPVKMPDIIKATGTGTPISKDKAGLAEGSKLGAKEHAGKDAGIFPAGRVEPVGASSFASDAASHETSSYGEESQSKRIKIRHSTTRALAFIPTGWADMGNYNKNHGSSSQDGITVHIIPYSEHSNCPELIEFVSFLKPREVLPTVYSDVSCIFS
jgi:hypothetical protein